MKKLSYQDAVLDLFATCIHVYPDISKESLILQHLSLLSFSSDISADIGEDLLSVLSMMKLSLEERRDLSLYDRKSFVYGMSAAQRDLAVVDLSDEDKFHRAISEFRCLDSHFDVYDIHQATSGYQMLVLHDLEPTFLIKK